MEFITNLLTGTSSAHAVFILSLVIALGIAIGNIRVLGVKLGVAGVLFAGLLFGHFRLSIDPHLLEFIREFGLILFVFTIGMQVGPGFFSSLKKEGLTLNLLAAAVVLLGAGITVLYAVTGLIPLPTAVGLFSGGTTNTPSLAAAQEALQLFPSLDHGMQKLPGLAYAMAYPFGIIGIILTMVLIRKIFRIDIKEQVQAFEKEHTSLAQRLSGIDVVVENKNLHGMALRDIPLLTKSGVVASRILHDEDIAVAKPESIIHAGDIIHLVGPKDKLKEAVLIIGSLSAINLSADVSSDLITRTILVSKPAMVGKTVREILLTSMFNLTVTRVNRAGVEFSADPELKVQYADILTVVGEESSLRRLASVLGDSRRDLDVPHLMSLFVGIAFGIIIGSWPIQLPGIPSPVKLGLAGGPLLAAIILSRLGHWAGLIWYMPMGANYMLREVGIALFLACVGLRSGDQFLSTFLTGQGIYWMALASVITLLPLLIVGLIAWRFSKVNYLTICGLLAGAMTDPPALAFANAQSKTNAVSVAYSTVYPLVMLLRVVAAQAMVLVLCR